MHTSQTALDCSLRKSKTLKNFKWNLHLWDYKSLPGSFRMSQQTLGTFPELLSDLLLVFCVNHSRSTPAHYSLTFQLFYTCICAHQIHLVFLKSALSHTCENIVLYCTTLDSVLVLLVQVLNQKSCLIHYYEYTTPQLWVQLFTLFTILFPSMDKFIQGIICDAWILLCNCEDGI